MKKALYILVIALAVASVPDAQAQRSRSRHGNNQRVQVRAGGGNATREVRVAGNFSEISSRGIADVEYRQSPDGRTRVEIQGTANLIPYVEVENVRGILEIRWARNVDVRGSYRLLVVVSSPGVNKLSTSGTGNIRINGQLEARGLELSTHGTGDIRFSRIQCDDLRVVARGTGDVEGGQVRSKNINIAVSGTGDVEISSIDAWDVEVSVSGTGDVEIGGRARDAVLKLRGTGDLDAYRLKATHVDATLSGVGGIKCYAEESLRASASGIGSIVFGGNPRTVDVRGNKKAVKRK